MFVSMKLQICGAEMSNMSVKCSIYIWTTAFKFTLEGKQHKVCSIADIFTVVEFVQASNPVKQ